MKNKPSDLLYYVQQLNNLGFEILSSGNFSLRLDDNLIAITPSGVEYGNIKQADIAIVDIQGNQISGLIPSSDISSHLEIYVNRKDINCIVHTHSHYATVMSIISEPLKVLSTLQADYFGKEIICLPYINHRVENFGKQFLSLGDNEALLANHGALIVDFDPAKAIKKAMVLEEISKINFHVGIYTKNIRPISAEDTLKLYEYYSKAYGQPLL